MIGLLAVIAFVLLQAVGIALHGALTQGGIRDWWAS